MKKIDYAIKIAEYCYRVLATPVITDHEFDLLFSSKQKNVLSSDILLIIEKTISKGEKYFNPLCNGGDFKMSDNKILPHKFRMLSIANASSEDEVAKWMKSPSTVEEKIDGDAVSGIFKYGTFQYALTRGDHVKGQIIQLANLIFPKTISNKLSYFEIRGEAYIEREDFIALNEERKENGEKLFANPRNLVSGTLKLSDASEFLKRKVKFIAYRVLTDGYVPLEYDAHTSQEGSLLLLKQLGFNIPNYAVAENLNEAMSFLNKVQQNRPYLPYDIDGAVLKVNNLSSYIEKSGNYPDYYIAYKFPGEQARVILVDVVFQIGKSGKLTPVAVFEPVYLMGTMVERATLNSIAWLLNLKIKIGDTLIITKGGDIIPKVIAVDFECRNEAFTEIQIPSFCPDCNSILQIDGEHIFCKNYSCPGVNLEKLAFFPSKGAFDIPGLGYETIQMLFFSGIINRFSDIIMLNVDVLARYIGIKVANKILAEINNAIHNRKFADLLTAISIPSVGRSTAEKLSTIYKDIDDIIKNISIEKLISIEDISYITSNKIISWFGDSENINELKKLNSLLTFKQLVVTSSNLAGKSICITGTLNQTRNYYKNLVESNGGIFENSVTGSTSYLVIGDNPGKDKLDKAEKNKKIKILQANEFYNLINC